MVVTTFPLAPAGFDPLKADSASLCQYGYPPRPDENSKLLEYWRRLFGRSLLQIEPTFKGLEHKRHKSPLMGGISSLNWSGALMLPPAGSAFSQIIGQWKVPTFNQDVLYGNCLSWIGIDGSGSTDVLQAGVACEANSEKGTVQLNVYPWWQWYPEVPIPITNLPVSSGDSVFVFIMVTSSTSGVIMFSNYSQGTITSFLVTAPPGTSLAGNSAEWIVERPSDENCKLTILGDYGKVEFDPAAAVITNGTLFLADVGKPINMMDRCGNIISTATIPTYDSVICTFNNSGSGQVPAKRTPKIFWSGPGTILATTPLSANELNACAVDTASGAILSGTFTYNPPAGTIFGGGGTFQLTTLFSPTDSANYNAATACVEISVLNI